MENGINKKNFGERLQNKRLERGLTRETLAEQIDCSTVFLAEVESGKKLMRLEKLYYVALTLRTSADYLLDLDIGYPAEEDALRNDIIKDIRGELSRLSTEDLQTASAILKAFTNSRK